MTLAEIKQSNELYLIAEDVAPLLRTNPNTIRAQAKERPELLGFPVVVLGKRVIIPRRAFLEFFGE